MTEYEIEPVRGLPGMLPPGERILWQGTPDRRALARTAFHTRLVAGYFAVLVAWATIAAGVHGIHAPGDLLGAAMTLALGLVGVGLLHLLAWGSARTTVYTLTDRRIVLRIGIALPTCVNLPLGQIGAVDLALRTDGSGDLPLAVLGIPKLGYLALWPHARPWRLVTPQPMLRAVPDAATVAALIARTCVAADPNGQATRLDTRLPARAAQDQAVAA